MPRYKDNNPTHAWLVLSRVLYWLSLVSVAVAVILGITVYTIAYTIRRDCDSPYTRDLKIGGYWITVAAGSAKADCPDYRGVLNEA